MSIFTRPAVEFNSFLLERPKVCQVLIDCWEPVQRIFGWGTVIHMALEEDPEGSKCIHADIQWHGGYNEGRKCLDKFDEQFWLDRARDVASELMFNIECVE